jgi:hypothetical protein
VYARLKSRKEKGNIRKIRDMILQLLEKIYLSLEISYIYIIHTHTQHGILYSESQNPEGPEIQRFFNCHFAVEAPLSNMAASVLAQVTELFRNLWWWLFRQSG